MANIFRKKDAYIDRVNRSTFDLSFVNNLTMKFGAITPVCLLPASFGDSFQINTRFNLQLLPTVFPIQTQMYVRLHFVYVRTRTLWEDWMSFFGGDETVTPPWMNVLPDGDTSEHKAQFNISDDLQTGTLADYLGVPTTITGTYGQTSEAFRIPYNQMKGISINDDLTSTPAVEHPVFGGIILVGATVETLQDFWTNCVTGKPLSQSFDPTQWVGTDVGRVSNYIAVPFLFDVDSVHVDTVEFQIPTTWFSSTSGAIAMGFYNSSGRFISGFNANDMTSSVKGSNYVISTGKSNLANVTQIVFWVDVRKVKSDYSKLVRVTSYNDGSGIARGFLRSVDILNSFVYVTSSGQWTKPEAANCPFYTADSKQMPAISLSALPFRAYEAYYNAFGRDIRNNPFIVDGKPEYNRYVPSVKGGPDTYKYQLHYANWEADAYTTALQSPQAGVAPLVGITSLGEATFRDAAGVEYHAQLETAEDGKAVV